MAGNQPENEAAARMLGRLLCFWSGVRKSRRDDAQVRREAANAVAITA